MTLRHPYLTPKRLGIIMAVIAVNCFVIGYNVYMLTHRPHELSEPEKRMIAVKFMCAPDQHWKGMEMFCGQYAMDSKK